MNLNQSKKNFISKTRDDYEELKSMGENFENVRNFQKGL